jgi:hypothetical protein
MNEDPVFGRVLYSYSRKQALEDGVLVDLTEFARETGFKVGVACTHAVWSGVITPPEESRKLFGQSERGRAHDVLFLLFCEIRRRKGTGQAGGSELLFSVLMDNRPAGAVRKVQLKSVAGPGDDGELTLTIMEPEES